MTDPAYIRQLKHKQLQILDGYCLLVQKAKQGMENPSRPFIRSFQEQERAFLNKLDHLHQVITAFPPEPPDGVDREISDLYLHIQDELDDLISLVRNKKNLLGLRDKQFLLKSQRRNRLYREIKPSYIDIRT